MARVELELVRAGGEPVDFWRTVNSHGLNDLVPNRIDSVERTLELTLHPGPQTVLVRKAGPTSVTVEGRSPRRVASAVRHVLRLDEDLSPLYAQLAEDPALSWASHGAGRWMRSQSVFEDVVKVYAAPVAPSREGNSAGARPNCCYRFDTNRCVRWTGLSGSTSVVAQEEEVGGVVRSAAPRRRRRLCPPHEAKKVTRRLARCTLRRRTSLGHTEID